MVKRSMPSACDSHVLGGVESVDDWPMLILMTPDAFYAFLRALFLIVVPTWHREASCARAAPPLPQQPHQSDDDEMMMRKRRATRLARSMDGGCYTPSIAAEVDFLIDFEK